jgi:hypothetical protein
LPLAAQTSRQNMETSLGRWIADAFVSTATGSRTGSLTGEGGAPGIGKQYTTSLAERGE